MLTINKNPEPEFFRQAKAKIKNQKTHEAWEDSYIDAVRARLRDEILRTEQDSLCVYCEAKINSDKGSSNLDHFIKRSLNQKLTLAYDNLLVSCNSAGRCSDSKDSKIRDLDSNLKIINPVVDDPDKYFDYMNSGEIFAKKTENEAGMKRARFTIEKLQLNQHRLVARRKTDGTKIARWLTDKKARGEKMDKQKLSALIKACFPSFTSFQRCIIKRSI